ncbi:MAG: tRNA epoxyqueuosine(34) reductase QueG [Bacteriovoracaceae bacterium]|jgi:epoxyqueuosine reductase|nr:tRNA epoxyqueuosine(34) reductase QueG [Halobacteriovoraceae bacterium]MDP7321495.1 tRNA epoxyqueuosine(34) reductase QueG [Bacteriovoracaceae bacterium]
MNQLFSLSPKLMADARVVDWAYTEKLEPTTYQAYLNWIDHKSHGPLNYLADERKEKRKNLKEIFPQCQSALVFLFDYRDSKKTIEKLNPSNKIASYTVGFEDQDYHFWIKDKLNNFARILQKDIKNLEYQFSLDVHPVLERDLAYRSGLGWFGKNSMLISRKYGSYTIIGSLLLNQRLDLLPKTLETDHCGSCTRCLQACPTNAIMNETRTIDTKKCISTFTIELFKDAIPPAGYPPESHEVFGCDICQEVCPWNNKALQKVEGQVKESSLVSFFDRDLKQIYSELEQMSNKEYKTFFKGTSFERLGKKGMLKNLKYYLNL